MMRQTMTPTRPPLFIVGAPSSGTTLLRNILWSHPWYYSTHETNFYAADYRTADWYRWVETRMLGDLETSNVRWRLADCLEYTMAFIRDLSERHPLRRDFVSAFFEAIRKYGSGETWVEKTPRHLGHLDRIRADFPEALVLYIHRDPRDTTLSIASRDWFTGTYRDACGIWRQQMEAFRPHRHLIDYRISYEDLCTRPASTVRALFDYLGAPYDHEDETFHEILSGPEYARCPVYTSLHPISADSIGRHRRELSPEDEETFLQICGGYVELSTGNGAG